MIHFKKIRWKNFLSTGNAFSEIELDKSPTTLIVGTNGAGKSTMLDAICFALFNKPFRRINKPQLINAINEKDCVVEVEFNIGSKEYLVKRGMKPNLFEIYQNGKMLNQEASAVDQQKSLEQTILKLNYKSFTQVVILGSSTFVPFMQLPPAHRREVIEDLLDIKIFSAMNIILKDRVRILRDNIRELDSKIEIVKEKVNIQKRFIADLKEQSEKNTKEKEDKIKKIEEEIKFLDSFNVLKLEACQQIENDLSGMDNVESQLNQLKVFESKFTDKSKKLNNDYKFFTENDKCPTCKQSITEEFRDQTKIDITKSLEEIKQASADLQQKINDISATVKTKQDFLSQMRTLQQEIGSNYKEIEWKKNQISDLEAEVKTQNSSNANISREEKKIKEIISEGVQLEKNISQVKKDRDNHEVITSLLKDTGIKARIIKKYLPVMNQLINKFLKEMDFYVSFHLDENFEESIKSRMRDDFTYASFSEGEKMRIDLALLFTWRTIAKMKNSANTNLLILDEIFDSSLDVNGTDDFLRILKSFSEGTNVFVISHKPDVLQDKFQTVLRVEKQRNFSVIKEDSVAYAS
jgi:DNA repair exonuclease SbcCD ATPase subunit